MPGRHIKMLRNLNKHGQDLDYLDIWLSVSSVVYNSLPFYFLVRRWGDLLWMWWIHNGAFPSESQ